MKKFTDEQEAAIGFTGESAVISAAAGSGKTSVIVERAIRLITGDNPVPADKIALVTYTRKAAAEMKQRLEQALLKKMSENMTYALESQLARLDDAAITTIDAFCLNIIRSNFGFAGVEPSFAVADGEQLALISKDAMNDTLEKFYEEFTEDQIVLATAFFGGNGDIALQESILDLYGFVSRLPDPDAWIDEQARLYGNPDAYYDKLSPVYGGFLREDTNEAVTLIKESLRIAEYDKTKKFLNTELDWFAGGKSDYPRKDADRKENASVKEIIGKNRERTAELKEGIEQARAMDSCFKEAVTRLAPAVNLLIKLYRIYGERFTARKRGAGVVDFTDAERLCLDVLKIKIAAEKIRNDYEYIIVDEFQDSNFLQYEIFRLLDGERGRLYFVGDIKQSIYRFRGADCSVFAEAAEKYRTLYLSNNFRSSEQVVESVNGIFERIMPHYEGKAKLKAARGVSDPLYKTEFALLSDENADGLETEARYTAARINGMIADGFPVFDRPCGYGDFAVITSAGDKNFAVYRKIFAEYGIPCTCAGADNYLKADEVGLAADLLTVIDNPYNDLSLFNLLMSPLYGFSAEEIAVIRQNRKNTPLYSALAAAKKGNNKIAAFLEMAARFRRIADDCSVTELIAALGSGGAFLPLSPDRQSRANIRLLSYYAENFEKSCYNGGLSAFLNYLNELKKSGANVKQADSEHSADKVRLTTIHAAKGLEFPICFVGRVNQQFNFSGRGEGKKAKYFKFDKFAGICALCFDEKNLLRFKTMHRDLIRRLNIRETAGEEARKLYVAATRAEFKLIFTGFARDGEIQRDSYAKWIDGNAEYVSTDIPAVISPETPKTFEKTDGIIFRDYPRRVLENLPRKLTATQVGVIREYNYDESDEPSVFPRNPSFYGEGRLTGKKRGDAYHKAMELIDFAKGDYARQLSALKPRFTPVEFRAVNAGEILGFFNSDLGKRAVKSAKAEKVVKEYKLYTEVDLEVYGNFADKPLVQGMADMFFYEDGEIVLVDYKTNRGAAREKLIREYSGQLEVYKKAISEMTGARVKECWIYSFEMGGIAVGV